MGFSVRDEADCALPILSRSQGAPVAARELLALLIHHKREEMPELDQLGEQVELETLIASLVFQDPHRLARRRSWEALLDRAVGHKVMHGEDEALDSLDSHEQCVLYPGAGLVSILRCCGRGNEEASIDGSGCRVRAGRGGGGLGRAVGRGGKPA